MSVSNIALTAGGITAGSVAGITAALAMNKVLGYSSNTAVLNGITMTYALSRYYFGNLLDVKPSCVVAGIPLGTVHELSHGISDREVKYRANGGIFLAHQDGGNESLRVVGRAYGINRYIFLNMLDLLFLYGSSTRIDLLAQAGEAAKSAPPFQYYTDFSQLENLPVNSERVVITRPDGSTATVNVKRRVEANNEAWEEFDLKNIREGYHDKHLTFPIITKHRIYLSMYIETYSWRQSIDKTGQKHIEYTIFFRKYDPQPKYEFKKMVFPARNGVVKTKVVYRQKEISHPLYRSMIKAAVELIPSFIINLEEHGKAINLFAGWFMRQIANIGRNDALMPAIMAGAFF